MSSNGNENIESVLKETRTFPPPATFSANAHISSEEQYEAIDPSEMHTLLVEAQDRVLPQMDRTLSRSAVRRMLRIGIEVYILIQLSLLT
ncbi:MAG: hypothetical protein ACO3FE_01165, partial [Planctomycetaceae bacterium]